MNKFEFITRSALIELKLKANSLSETRKKIYTRKTYRCRKISELKIPDNRKDNS